MCTLCDFFTREMESKIQMFCLLSIGGGISTVQEQRQMMQDRENNRREGKNKDKREGLEE